MQAPQRHHDLPVADPTDWRCIHCHVLNLRHDHECWNCHKGKDIRTFWRTFCFSRVLHVPPGEDTSNDSYICPICLDHCNHLDVVADLPCGHLFHCRCLQKIVDRGSRICPCCRNPVPVQRVLVTDIANTEN